MSFKSGFSFIVQKRGFSPYVISRRFLQIPNHRLNMTLTVKYFYFFVNTYKGTLHITTKLCNACTGSRPSHDGECGRCCRGCNQEEGQELELELSELEMQDLEVPELEVSEMEVPELDVKELEKKLQKKNR